MAENKLADQCSLSSRMEKGVSLGATAERDSCYYHGSDHV